MNSLLAMVAELCRRFPRRRHKLWPAYSMFRGFPWVAKQIFLSTHRRGRAARVMFGRATGAQACDMWRAWWRSSLPPHEYYEALLARHSGGDQLYDYLNGFALQQIVITLQFDTYGAPSFPLNDKAALGEWLRSNDLPSPAEFALEPGGPPPDSADLRQLGDSLVVKPRAAGRGVGVAAWKRESDGMWYSAAESLSEEGLIESLAQRATGYRFGIVAQERLSNHTAIVDLCGETLSTCRIVTIRNEQDEPEVVEFLWRMATRPDTVVDSYRAGGTFWAARDFESGEIAIGVDPGMAARQEILTHHPVTGKAMIGYRHPLWADARDLALMTHRHMPEVLLAGWDIATTPDGPMVVELNVPVALDPLSQLVNDGIETSRYGEILAWHARAWMNRELPPGSRRRVAAAWSSE